MKLTDVTPNLVVSDVNRSLAFYRDLLGFQVVTTVPEQPPFAFVWVQRDGVSVFLNSEASAHAKATAGSNALFITIEAGDVASGVDAMFARLDGKAPLLMPLTDQFYGMREFTIEDPDGHVIVFAQASRQA